MANEKGYRVAVVGATGAVGQKIIQFLEEKPFQIDAIKLLSSKRSAGKKLLFNGEEVTVEEATEQSFEEVDIAFFSAGGAVSKKLVPAAVKSGAVVIDNTSAFRMDEDVPLVVPEVNEEDLKHHKGIIANPNCSTIQSVVALQPLQDEFGVKRVHYATYQSVSGSGEGGIRDLEEGANGAEPTTYPHPIFNNVLPHIDDFLEDGYTKEEKKMIDETKKILEDDTIQVVATAVRIPVVGGHSESVNIQFEKDFDLGEVRQMLHMFPGISLKDSP
ncbi:MAG: aspartate-semialdehyde dehydrogenase, partial [Bacillales bacterium]